MVVSDINHFNINSLLLGLLLIPVIAATPLNDIVKNIDDMPTRDDEEVNWLSQRIAEAREQAQIADVHHSHNTISITSDQDLHASTGSQPNDEANHLFVRDSPGNFNTSTASSATSSETSVDWLGFMTTTSQLQQYTTSPGNIVNSVISNIFNTGLSKTSTTSFIPTKTSAPEGETLTEPSPSQLKNPSSSSSSQFWVWHSLTSSDNTPIIPTSSSSTWPISSSTSSLSYSPSLTSSPIIPLSTQSETLNTDGWLWHQSSSQGTRTASQPFTSSWSSNPKPSSIVSSLEVTTSINSMETLSTVSPSTSTHISTTPSTLMTVTSSSSIESQQTQLNSASHARITSPIDSSGLTTISISTVTPTSPSITTAAIESSPSSVLTTSVGTSSISENNLSSTTSTTSRWGTDNDASTSRSSEFASNSNTRDIISKSSESTHSEIPSSISSSPVGFQTSTGSETQSVAITSQSSSAANPMSPVTSVDPPRPDVKTGLSSPTVSFMPAQATPPSTYDPKILSTISQMSSSVIRSSAVADSSTLLSSASPRETSSSSGIIFGPNFIKTHPTGSAPTSTRVTGGASTSSGFLAQISSSSTTDNLVPTVSTPEAQTSSTPNESSSSPVTQSVATPIPAPMLSSSTANGAVTVAETSSASQGSYASIIGVSIPKMGSASVATSSPTTLIPLPIPTETNTLASSSSSTTVPVSLTSASASSESANSVAGFFSPSTSTGIVSVTTAYSEISNSLSSSTQLSHIITVSSGSSEQLKTTSGNSSPTQTNSLPIISQPLVETSLQSKSSVTAAWVGQTTSSHSISTESTSRPLNTIQSPVSPVYSGHQGSAVRSSPGSSKAPTAPVASTVMHSTSFSQTGNPSQFLPTNLVTEAPEPSPTPSTMTTSTVSFTGSTATPSASANLPFAIAPQQTPKTDKSKRLVQVGFKFPLNYPFVAAHSDAAAQIFQYLPEGFAQGLNIDEGEIVMLQLIPHHKTGARGFLQTIAQFYIPKDIIDKTQKLITDLNSPLYKDQSDMTVLSLMKLIDVDVPLASNYGNGDDSAGSSGSDGNDSVSGSNRSGSGSDNNNLFNTGRVVGAPGSLDQALQPNMKQSKASGKVAGITIGTIAGAGMIAAILFLCSIAARNAMKKGRSDIDDPVKPPDMESYHDGSSSISSRWSHIAGGPALVAAPEAAHAGSEVLTSPNRSGPPPISYPIVTENSLGWQ